MRRIWVYLMLLVLAVVFFWRLWPAPDGFLYRPNSDDSDLMITHWPNALFIRQSLATWGQVPLWRHLILGGEPFAANPLSGLWYPPNLLLLILPLTVAFNLLFVLHMAWAGWGAYRLARSIGASWAGGLLAALTVMLTPKAMAHLASGHVGLYYAWAWSPWVLWAARRLAKRHGPGDVATAAATAAMLILADVRLGFYGGLAAAGYWVVNLKSQIPNLKWQTTAAIGAVLLAGALMAVQMMPLAAVSGRLNRGGLALEESGIASLPPSYLVGLLVADHGGFQETMTYLGAVGLFLALVGLLRWRERERWWWGGLALVAVVYSLGTNTPFYGLLYRVLPPLGWLRGPARAWFLVVLAAAVLAARGLTELEETRFFQKTGFLRRPWTDRVAVGLAGAALAGGIGGAVLRLPANVVAAAVVWPLAGMLIALRAGGRLRRALFVGLTLALALADLFYVGSTLYRVRPAGEVLTEGEAAVAWLAEQPGRFRVYSPSYSIPQHTGAVYGVEMADGVDPFQLADYVDFMRAATGVDLPGYSVTVPSFPEVPKGEDMLLAHRNVVPDLRLLGLLNVRYLAAAYPMEVDGLVSLGERDGVHLYRNEQALPRAFMVQGQGVWESEGAREARVVQWTPNHIQVEAEGPGLLVLSEVYDPDWRVRVDGETAELVCIKRVLRGVYLEDGLHQVEFIYWPFGLTVGVVSTALGWACVAVLWLFSRNDFCADSQRET
ncbi:MAG: YfhO family protein [Anaerolineae bacterium]|nr:YfhO family protein [Anaerolineae bacterium]